MVAAGVSSVVHIESEVADVVKGRMTHLSSQEMADAIALRPVESQLDEAMTRFRTSGGWRSAEERMRRLVLALTRFFTAARLEELCQILQENAQVNQSSGMPEMLDAVFEDTKELLGATSAWRSIASFLEKNGRDEDPEDWYACPELRSKIAAL